MTSQSKNVLAILPLLLLCVVSSVLAEESSGEDVDEGSCICGINTDLIKKLEAILQSASTQCVVSSGHSSILTSSQEGNSNQHQHESFTSNGRDPVESRPPDISANLEAITNQGDHLGQDGYSSIVEGYGSSANVSSSESSDNQAQVKVPEQVPSSSTSDSSSALIVPNSSIAVESEQTSSTATTPAQATSAPDLSNLEILLAQQGYTSAMISQIINHLKPTSDPISLTSSSSTSGKDPNTDTNSNVEINVEQQQISKPTSSDEHDLSSSSETLGKQDPEIKPSTEVSIQSESSSQNSGGLDTAQMILQLTAELHKLQSQLNLQSTNSYNHSSSHSQSYQTLTPQPISTSAMNEILGSSQASSQSISTQTAPFTQSSQSNHITISASNLPISNPNPTTSLINNHIQTISGGGVLGGVPSVSANDALIKLNQSITVAPQEMASALQSTVPNVVTNIFSDIQNLTLHQNSHQSNNRDDPNLLTSIDGSSVSLVGDTSNQITAEGEKLFSLWIEHQLESLHLTASMANYIRKNAMNLFKRIASQYVEQASRLGGSVERNVQQATQKALTTSQNLIAFILRYYLNFAGGMMQIIGEQVSRVGKQLDSTGETIAHINLNPFDMMSNVIESLPNPSDYSHYFRAFGKQLMGESPTSSIQSSNEAVSTDLPPTQSQSQPTEQPTPQSTTSPPRSPGLLSKTMKSLGKTMSSWIG